MYNRLDFSREELILRDYLALERTNLAAERTLLSYLRTGVGLFASGIGLIKLLDTVFFHNIGYVLLALFPIVTVIGILRFISSRNKMKHIDDRFRHKFGVPEEL